MFKVTSIIESHLSFLTCAIFFTGSLRCFGNVCNSLNCCIALLHKTIYLQHFCLLIYSKEMLLTYPLRFNFHPACYNIKISTGVEVLLHFSLFMTIIINFELFFLFGNIAHCRLCVYWLLIDIFNMFCHLELVWICFHFMFAIGLQNSP